MQGRVQLWDSLWWVQKKGSRWEWWEGREGGWMVKIWNGKKCDPVSGQHFAPLGSSVDLALWDLASLITNICNFSSYLAQPWVESMKQKKTLSLEFERHFFDQLQSLSCVTQEGLSVRGSCGRRQGINYHEGCRQNQESAILGKFLTSIVFSLSSFLSPSVGFEFNPRAQIATIVQMVTSILSNLNCFQCLLKWAHYRH